MPRVCVYQPQTPRPSHFLPILATTRLFSMSASACRQVYLCHITMYRSVADLSCVSFKCSAKWFTYIYIIYITHMLFQILSLTGYYQLLSRGHMLACSSITWITLLNGIMVFEKWKQHPSALLGASSQRTGCWWAFIIAVINNISFLAFSVLHLVFGQLTDYVQPGFAAFAHVRGVKTASASSCHRPLHVALGSGVWGGLLTLLYCWITLIPST